MIKKKCRIMKKINTIILFFVFFTCLNACLGQPQYTQPSSVDITPIENISTYSTPFSLPSFIYSAGSGMIRTASSWQSTARFWRGMVGIDLPTPERVGFPTARAITVTNGIVYTAGFYRENRTFKPVFWRGMERFELPIPVGTSGGADAIAVDNDGTVYILGDFFFPDRLGLRGRSQSCFWINDKRIDLSENFYARAIAVYNGSVFIAGSYRDENSIFSTSKPVFFQGSEKVNLTVPDETSSGIVYAIAVYEGTVYTAGEYTINGVRQPAFWRGTERFDLSVPSVFLGRVFINTITVAGGTAYISGSYVVERNVGRNVAGEIYSAEFRIFNISANMGNYMLYPVRSLSPSRFMICYWRDTDRVDLGYIVSVQPPVRAIAVSDGKVFNVADSSSVMYYWENNVLKFSGTIGIGIDDVFIDK